MMQLLPNGNIFTEYTNRAGKSNRKPSEAHSKNQQKYKSQPKCRKGTQNITYLFQNTVRKLVLVHSHDTAKTETYDCRQNPCTQHQCKRIDKAFPDNIDNRPAVNCRLSEIAFKQLGKPAEIAFDRRFVYAPIIFYFSSLFRRNCRSQAENILLHRIYR